MLGRALSGRFASTSAPCRLTPSFQSLHAQLPRLRRGYKCLKATPERKESLAGDENGMSPRSLKLHGPICAGTKLYRTFTEEMEAHLKIEVHVQILSQSFLVSWSCQRDGTALPRRRLQCRSSYTQMRMS